MSTSAPAVALAVAVGAAALVLLLRRRRQRSPPVIAEGLCARRKPVDAAADGGAGASGCIMLVPQTFSDAFQLEYSVHRVSRLLRSDVELVFRPDLDDAYKQDPRGEAAGVSKDAYLQECLLAVPTWQPAKGDLSEISYEVNQERRELLANFDVWAAAVRPRLDWWSDCSCPMEGNARYGKSTSTIYNELEGLTQLLRYDAIPIGCCGIVLHPKWQRRAYPVTFFTTAPLETLKAVLADVERRGAKKAA